MKLSGLIDALVAAGGSMDQVRAVVAAAEAQEEAVVAARRAKAAAKKRRQRDALSPNVPGTPGDAGGQPGQQKEDPRTPKEKLHPHSPPSEARAPKGADSSRGRRIDPDWTLDDVGRAYAASQGLTPSEVDGEASKFRDFWLAKAGADGRKADWAAAWRTWVRGAVDRRGRVNGSRAGPMAGSGQHGRNVHLAALEGADDLFAGSRR